MFEGRKYNILLHRLHGSRKRSNIHVLCKVGLLGVHQIFFKEKKKGSVYSQYSRLTYIYMNYIQIYMNDILYIYVFFYVLAGYIT